MYLNLKETLRRFFILSEFGSFYIGDLIILFDNFDYTKNIIKIILYVRLECV